MPPATRHVFCHTIIQLYLRRNVPINHIAQTELQNRIKLLDVTMVHYSYGPIGTYCFPYHKKKKKRRKELQRPICSPVHTYSNPSRKLFHLLHERSRTLATNISSNITQTDTNTLQETCNFITSSHAELLIQYH